MDAGAPAGTTLEKAEHLLRTVFSIPEISDEAKKM